MLQATTTPKAAPFLFGGARPVDDRLIAAQGALMGGSMNLTRPVMRASGPSTLQADVHPLMAFAQLELGTPQHIDFPGHHIAPDVLQSSWEAAYWTWLGTPQLQIGEEGFERAFSVARRTVRFTGTTTLTQMTRRGAKSPLDWDEILIADNQLALAAHAGLLARDVVELAVESEKQKLFGEVASYPAGHTLVATGSEWDKPVTGDSLADVEVAVAQLLLKNQPYQRSHIHAVLTTSTRDAVIADPTWAALPNSPQSRGERIGESHILERWGVGQVTVADAVFDPADGGDIRSLWGDVAVFFIDPRLRGELLVTNWGRATFAKSFKFQGAGNRGPFNDDDLTTVWHPHDSYDHPAITKGVAGFLITGTSVNV